MGLGSLTGILKYGAFDMKRGQDRRIVRRVVSYCLIGIALMFSLGYVPVAMASSLKDASFLPLKKAISMAIENNPEMLAAIEEISASNARLIQAKGAIYPRIDLVESYMRTDNPVMVFMEKLNQELFSQSDFKISHLNDPAFRTDWSTQIILTQPVFNGGREITERRIAQKWQEIALLKRRAVENGMAFKAEEAYLSLLLRQDRVAIIKKAIETARAGVELARSRYRNGAALKSDVLTAEARLMRLKEELSSAMAEEGSSWASLNKVIAVPQGARWRLSHSVLNAQLDTGQNRDIQYWLSAAMDNRPELLIAERLINIARIKQEGARLNFFPSLNLKGVYERHGEDVFSSDGASWSIMARADFNIFNGKRDKGRLIEAASEVKRQEALRQKVRSYTEFQVRDAFFELMASKDAIASSEKGLQRAKEALNILRKRYKEELSLMIEVLDAEDAVKEAEIRVKMAKFREKIAFLRLRLFSGIILD